MQASKKGFMEQNRTSLVRFAWLSIGAALVTIGLKSGAYWLTGSVGLLSDALESLVNLFAACLALFVLSVVAQPADDDHQYGHDKAEYFSSGAEGGMILVAAIGIIVTAVQRLLHPIPLEHIGIGLLASMVASLVNFSVARVLLVAGRRYQSITLEADAHHLMTDVWTSIGVLVGVLLVSVSGLVWLDPIVAILVGVNIIWTGIRLVRHSILGLMDTALPEHEQSAIKAILAGYQAEGVQFHELQTRSAASRRFVSMHILVPGGWTVQRGHDLLEKIEAQIRQTLPNTEILTHLEPIEDPASWEGKKAQR
jgi:cation diffusion facilitator family transporter